MSNRSNNKTNGGLELDLTGDENGGQDPGATNSALSPAEQRAAAEQAQAEGIAALAANDGGLNIKFVGRPVYGDEDATEPDQMQKIVSDPQPLESFSDSGRVVTLPDADVQKAGPFYHEDAGLIAQYFPHLYKIVTDKS